MDNPELFGNESAQGISGHEDRQIKDKAIEIEADILVHVAGGCVGGGGISDNGAATDATR